MIGSQISDRMWNARWAVHAPKASPSTGPPSTQATTWWRPNITTPSQQQQQPQQLLPQPQPQQQPQQQPHICCGPGNNNFRFEQIFALCRHNQKRIESTSQQIEDLQTQIKGLQTSIVTLTDALQKSIEVKSIEIKSIEVKSIDKINNSCNEVEKDIHVLQLKKDETQEDVPVLKKDETTGKQEDVPVDDNHALSEVEAGSPFILVDPNAIYFQPTNSK